MYLISWILKGFRHIYMRMRRIRNECEIGKVAFYIIFIHNKLHFSIFNVFISSGIMLITRTLIHMKLVPETTLMKYDKVLAFICLVLVCLDFIDLISTAVEYSSELPTRKERIERKKRIREIEKVKEFVQRKAEMLPSSNSPSNTLNESQIGMNQSIMDKEDRPLPY